MSIVSVANLRALRLDNLPSKVVFGGGKRPLLLPDVRMLSSLTTLSLKDSTNVLYRLVDLLRQAKVHFPFVYASKQTIFRCR